MSTRREFLQVMGLLSIATLTPARLLLAQAQQEALTAKKLRENAWFIAGEGGNSLLLKTPDGPILCDTKVPTAAAALRDETIRLTGSLPKLLINTHHHYDHIGGNDLLGEQATMIAHRNFTPRARASLEFIRRALREERRRLLEGGQQEKDAALMHRIDRLDVKHFTPDKEIDTEMELTHGGVKIRLLHYGPGHTDNDIVMFLPELNILHTGDLVFHELHPYIDRPAGASTAGWRRALAQAMKLCNDETTVIPGHGELTDRTGLKAQDDYFIELRRFVDEQIDAGRSREEIVAMKVPAFEGRGFEQVQPVALGVMYDELTADEGG